MLNKLKKIDWTALISDKDGTASIGKISFWLVLVPAMYFWLFLPIDIHPSHLQTLYAVIGYNLAKKTTWFGNPISRMNSDDKPTVKFGERWKKFTGRTSKFDQGEENFRGEGY